MIDLTDLTVRTRSVGSMDNNVYLLTAKSSGAQLLIDAADDADAIRALVQDASDDSPAQTQLETVVTTHSHWDHVRALGDIVTWSGAKTAAGADDIADITVPTDVDLHHLDTLDVGGVGLTVIALRGHTPGSVALLYRDPEGPSHLFTGDSLFPGGVGNTQGDSARFESLYTDVLERVFAVLDDDTVIHPGHGKGTTLGLQRPELQQWAERGW